MHTRKVLPLLLAVVLTLSLSMPAFAVENDTDTLVVATQKQPEKGNTYVSMESALGALYFDSLEDAWKAFVTEGKFQIGEGENAEKIIPGEGEFSDVASIDEFLSQGGCAFTLRGNNTVSGDLTVPAGKVVKIQATVSSPVTTEETFSHSFTGTITVESGGSLSFTGPGKGNYFAATTMTFSNPITVKSGGSLYLTSVGEGPVNHPTDTFTTSSESGPLIQVEEGGTATIEGAKLVSSSSSPVIESSGTVTIQKGRVKKSTYIEASGSAIEVKDGGTLTVSNNSDDQYGAVSISSSGSNAITVASGATLEIPSYDTVTITTTADSSQAISLSNGATLEMAGTKVTAAEGDNYINNNGIALFAAGASSGSHTMTGAVLHTDGTIIQGSDTEAPTVKTETTEEGTTTTTVTVPAGGSVKKADADSFTTMTNGGSASQVEGENTTITEATVSVTAITLDHSSLTLYSNTTPNTATLTATVTPSDATDKTVTWSSSNESVATVANGVVTAVAPGTATITATASDSSGKSAACTVTVAYAATPIAPSDTVRYIVEHYKESGSGYVLAETEYPAGKIGETVTAQPQDYDGYIYNEAISTASGKLTEIKVENDIVVLRLYYDEQPADETTYSVSVDATDGGTVKVRPSRAAQGETVTITVTPDEDYELSELTVTNRNGRELTVRDRGDGRYSFTMPASRVTVSVSFAEIEIETDSWLDNLLPLPRPGYTVTSQNPFADVATGQWYVAAVNYVYVNGLMSGTSATTFEPYAATNRAMIATILYRLEGQPPVSAAAFTDVSAGQWYTDAVAWASANGIVTGYGDGRFGPEAPITRQDLAVMLYRYAAYKGYDTSLSGVSIWKYVDRESISNYAMDAMTWAVNHGILTGSGNVTLSPTASATRAEVAQILMRFCQIIVN